MKTFLALISFAAIAVGFPISSKADDRHFDQGYNQDAINQNRYVQERVDQERFSHNSGFNYGHSNSNSGQGWSHNNTSDGSNYRDGFQDGYRAAQGSPYHNHSGATATTTFRPTPYDYSVYSGNNTVVHSYSSNYPYGFRQPLQGQSFYSYNGYSAYR